MTKANLNDTYLVPFDPYDHDGPFGFLRANITGREQWWLVQVWADHTGDDAPVFVRFLDAEGPDYDYADNAANFAGRPWYPLQWMNDDAPTARFAPAFRLTLDMPDGKRITHEWGPEAIGDAGRKAIDRMLTTACAGLVAADGDGTP